MIVTYVAREAPAEADEATETEADDEAEPDATEEAPAKQEVLLLAPTVIYGNGQAKPRAPY